MTLCQLDRGGIVNLSEGLAEEMRFFVEVGSGSSARLGDLAPSGKGSPRAKRGGSQQWRIWDKGCGRGSRLDRESTETIVPAGLI